MRRIRQCLAEQAFGCNGQSCNITVLSVPLWIVPGPNIPIHRLIFADRLQDGQEMLPSDIGRRIRLPIGIEQDVRAARAVVKAAAMSSATA